MSDLISRSDAIGAVKEERFPIDSDYAEGFMAALDKVEWILKEWLPSAQPETHEKRTETHSCDCISRQAAIDADDLDEEIRCEMCENPMHTDRGCDGNCKYDEILYEKIIQILNKRITPLPSAQPELCEDAVSRNAIIRTLNTMDRYVSEELTLCDTDEKYPKNEVFIVDDVYEEIVEKLPSAQPEIIHCKECKYGVQDEDKRWHCRGLGCQVGEADGSGFCADAERRTDEGPDR